MIKPVTVRCDIIEVRVKSLLVVDRARVSAWLPRASINVAGEIRSGGSVRVTLPAELAREKLLATETDERQGRML
jgi:hypothetical protein